MVLQWIHSIPPWLIATAIVCVVVSSVINIALLIWLIRLLKRTPHELPKISSPYSSLESRFIEVGDSRIHYLQTGSGPHLVLLHGIGASVFVWRYIIEELAKHFTVTALDLPGFGKSSKEVQADYGLDAQHRRFLLFLDELGIDQACLAGSSMGGTIALWAALHNPERFPKVAGLSPATDSGLVPRRLIGLARLVSQLPFVHKTLNGITMNLILRQVFSRSELVAQESVRAYLEPFLDEGISVRTFLAATELLADRRLPEAFANFSHPILLLFGARDRMVSRASIEHLRKLLPKSEFHMHQTSGHHLMEDEPQWSVEFLVNFFR